LLCTQEDRTAFKEVKELMIYLLQSIDRERVYNSVMVSLYTMSFNLLGLVEKNEIFMSRRLIRMQEFNKATSIDNLQALLRFPFQ
jgi:hypothetical protein